MLAAPVLRLLQALPPALALFAGYAEAAAVPRPFCKRVSTRHGDLCAYQSQGTGIDRFTVPYAKPPTGANRFADPVAIDRFPTDPAHSLSRHQSRSCRRKHYLSRDSFNASVLPQPCAQVNPATGETIGSEDCLYLTVYTPGTATLPYAKLPVFVWIHGGSFTAGSTAALDATAFAASQNVVVVMVQYRLGALGWLKADDFGVAGNFGLKDVVDALKFVNWNIASFGGDPDRVTLAGQSSGAEIVKTLLVTPAADSFFHRAILQSAPLDYPDLSVSTANTVGKHVVADILGLSDLASLRGASVDSILQAQTQLAGEALALASSMPDLSFAEPLKTVVDGSFVTRDFRQVVSSGGQLNIPSRNLLFTTVKEEGCASVGQMYEPFRLLRFTPRALADEPLPSISLTEPLPADYFTAYAYAFYPTRAEKILSSGLWDPSKLAGDSDAVRKQFSQLATDFFWTCPNHLTSRNIAKASAGTSKVYFGEFVAGIPYHPGQDRSICKNGVTHEDDILTIFTANPASSRYTWMQRTIADQVQARWASFARTGDPNAGEYSGWSAVTGGDGDLTGLAIGSSGGSIDQRTQQCAVYTYA
ncbi:hypothetical protein JCM10908_000049 [Rhodotorula pacifica]|uniref:uncharacterized protein n=1 Tax=Rhodotorula pacifica TaxID=1495444 RepID=UPI003178BE97